MKAFFTLKLLSKAIWAVTQKGIHVKCPSLGGRLPLFDPISLLSIQRPPKSRKLSLFGPYLLPFIFSLKIVNCIEFSTENALLSQQSVHKVRWQNVMHDIKSLKPSKRGNISDIMFKISAGIWMLMDEINVAERFHAKSQSFELSQLDMHERALRVFFYQSVYFSIFLMYIILILICKNLSTIAVKINFLCNRKNVV